MVKFRCATTVLRRGANDVETMEHLKTMSELKHLGPTSQAMLANAGITSLAQLRGIGAVAAYVLARQSNPRASLNLLWALEAALTGQPWQLVAREHRTSLLLALEQHEQCTKVAPSTTKEPAAITRKPAPGATNPDATNS